MIETTNSVQTIIITLGIITLIGSIYFCFYKIRTLQTTTLQTRRHLLYQQQIIEKHNKLLQTLTTGYTEPSLSSPISFDSNHAMSMEEPALSPPRPNNEEKKQSPPPTAAPLNNILPMISTIMGMMNNQPEEHGETESVLDEEEQEELEKKKMEMADEIEKELQELTHEKEIVEPTEPMEKKTINPIETNVEGRIDDIN